MCNKPGCRKAAAGTKTLRPFMSASVTATGLSDAVRMEYIGQNSGTVPWRCPSGHTYLGSKKSNRFADVFPEDVDYLVGSRRWRKVVRKIEIAEDTPAVIQPVETTKIEPIEAIEITVEAVKELAEEEEPVEPEESEAKPKRRRRKQE